MGMGQGGEDRATVVRLRDGRGLGYADYGDPQGWPLLFFHGTPGSRIMARCAAPLAAAWGIRLLAPERPGYGLSDPQPGRRLLDWPKDIREFAAALGLSRFSLVGVSGGGPYVAACAWCLPDLIEVAGIVSGLAPKDAMAGQLTRWQQVIATILPHIRLTRPFLAVMAGLLQRQPERWLTALLPLVPPEDRRLLQDPAIRQLQVDGIIQAWRQGVLAMAQDLAIFSQSWGFRVDEIRVPVYLWHGEADRLVPVQMGRYLASHIPGCQATFIPEAGHLWLFAGYEAILHALRDARQHTAR